MSYIYKPSDKELLHIPEVAFLSKLYPSTKQTIGYIEVRFTGQKTQAAVKAVKE